LLHISLNKKQNIWPAVEIKLDFSTSIVNMSVWSDKSGRLESVQETVYGYKLTRKSFAGKIAKLGVRMNANHKSVSNFAVGRSV